MEINPQAINSDSPNSGNESTYTYIYSWTPSEYVRGNIKITTCTGDTINSGWTTSGYTTISQSGKGSHYFLFQMQRYFYRSSTGYGWYDDEIASAQKQVLVDGVEINTVVGGTTVGTIAIPNFTLEGTLCDTNSVSLKIQPVEYANCNDIGWFPTDALTLRIIEGANYASFYNLQTGVNLGSNIVIDPFVSLDDLMIFWGLYWERDGLENIILKQNETVFPDSISHPIIIEATINGIIFTSETQWYPNNYNLALNSYPDSIDAGEYASIGISITNECRYFPMETKLNAEIIKGQEYGSLIDPYTYEKTKMLSNLDHWFGSAWIDLIADGKSPNQTDTVVIRISTTASEIVPKEINVYIKPPSVYVYTNPEVVGAADTAEIVVKKRNPVGTLEEFPQGQTFELAVLDGCVNGNILVGDSLGVYFSDVQLPIYFVAADSVAGDSGIVRLRVGTDLGGSSLKPITQGDEKNEKLTDEQVRMFEIKAGYKKMIEEKKEELLESKSAIKGEPPIEAPIREVCYYGNYLYETGYWEGDVVVEQDEWCEDLDECDEIEFPDIELEVYENNWQNLNVCADPNYLAGTAFFPSDSSCYRKDFDIELCKEEGSDKIQFTFDDDIVINCVSDFCEANIDADDVLINDAYSFPNGTTCYDKIYWLEKHELYPMPVGNIIYPGGVINSVYVIRDIWMRHEAVHRDHFLEVAEGFKAEYLIKIKETIKQCSEFSSGEDALSEFKQAAEKIIKQFYDATYNKDLKISTGGGNKVKELEFENNTIHKKVIDNYLQPLIDRWRLKKCVD